MVDPQHRRGDGRLIQLNSYENRVFQVFLEDGRVVVAKFYRPGRWSDAQILEEHAFAEIQPALLGEEANLTSGDSLLLVGDALEIAIRRRLAAARRHEQREEPGRD